MINQQLRLLDKGGEFERVATASGVAAAAGVIPNEPEGAGDLALQRTRRPFLFHEETEGRRWQEQNRLPNASHAISQPAAGGQCEVLNVCAHHRVIIRLPRTPMRRPSARFVAPAHLHYLTVPKWRPFHPPGNAVASTTV